MKRPAHRHTQDRVHAKVVFGRDHRQLAEIDAGGAARPHRAVPAIELKENRQEREREALAPARNGDPAEGLRRYEQHGRVLTCESADRVGRRLVADWWASRAREYVVMSAFPAH